MRFLVLVKASPESEAGVLPSSEMLIEMGKFNQGLAKDGIMLSGEGLQPSSKGARISFGGGKPTVIDGPFAETKELVAGFWILEGKSLEEIVQRLSHAPFEDGQIEIRRIFEMKAFAPVMTPEVERQHADLSAQLETQKHTGSR